MPAVASGYFDLKQKLCPKVASSSSSCLGNAEMMQASEWCPEFVLTKTTLTSLIGWRKLSAQWQWNKHTWTHKKNQ